MLYEEVLRNNSFTEYNLHLSLLFALKGAVTDLWRKRFSTVKVNDSLWSLVELGVLCFWAIFSSLQGDGVMTNW